MGLETWPAQHLLPASVSCGILLHGPILRNGPTNIDTPFNTPENVCLAFHCLHCCHAACAGDRASGRTVSVLYYPVQILLPP